jgi:hypothetical protein
MAFTQTRNDHEVRDANVRMVFGTFSNTEGSTGGIIHTKLHICRDLHMQLIGSSVVTTVPVVNDTFPTDGDVTIVTPANACGIWRAVGE